MEEHIRLSQELQKLSKTLPPLDPELLSFGKDYPDYITSEDFEGPILSGVDRYRRPVITYKCYVLGEKIDDEADFVMETVFVRYTEGVAWMSCGHGTRYHLLCTCGGPSVEQYKFWLELFRNGHAVLEDCHRPDKECWAGRKVVLANEKMWNAALFIQTRWRYCRDTPGQALCWKMHAGFFEKVNSSKE